MATNGKNPKDPVAEPASHGQEWSQGLFLAAVITFAVWVPAYMFVTDRCSDFWWCDFVIAFIVLAAVVTVSWFTCAIAEYLEKRQRKGAKIVR